MSEGPYPNHLAYFMANQGMTDPALAKKLDITKQQIFNLRHGRRKLTVEWAKQLAPHLGISWEMLITGPSPPADQARSKWLALYDALTEEQRDALLVVASGMVRKGDTPDPPPASAGSPRPLHLREAIKKNQTDPVPQRRSVA